VAILERKIIGFHEDEESHWVAELDCGHAQHTRHDPPFFPRPWVLTEAGRSLQIGTSLDCLRCDRQEIPDGYVAYRRTPEFTVETTPMGLRQHHSTKTGVWGVINVLRGQVRYRIHSPYNIEVLLDKKVKGIVIPEVEHEVEPLDDAAFYVEFWHRPEGANN
jgi:tellurite methyltransferase